MWARKWQIWLISQPWQKFQRIKVKTRDLVDFWIWLQITCNVKVRFRPDSTTVIQNKVPRLKPLILGFCTRIFMSQVTYVTVKSTVNHTRLTITGTYSHITVTFVSFFNLYSVRVLKIIKITIKCGKKGLTRWHFNLRWERPQIFNFRA